jgi:GTP cyclohydrolase IA
VRRDGRGRPDALLRRGVEIFLRGVDRIAREDLPQGSIPARAARVARAWQDDLLAGYKQDASRLLTPLAARVHQDLVAVRDLEFASVCRHHLLPFSGRVHLAYAPAGRITGLSRLARLVDCLAKRLQLQESLTREVADAIQQQLAPEGAACVIEADHACMTMRGSRPRGRIVTAAYTGSFRRSAVRRREVTALLLGRGAAAAPAPASRPAARRKRRARAGVSRSR